METSVGISNRTGVPVWRDMDDDSRKIAWSLASREVELILHEEDGSVFRAIVNEASLLRTVELCATHLNDEEHQANLRLLKYLAQNAESLLTAHLRRKEE